MQSTTHPLKNAVARVQRTLHCRYIKAYLKHKWNYHLVDNVTEAPVGFSSLQSLLFSLRGSSSRSYNKSSTLLAKTLFNRTANNAGWKGGGSNMYIKRVRLSSPTKDSPARTKDNIWERIQTHLPVPSVPLQSDIVAAWMSSSPDNSWCATKSRECFFNDGQVDTLILKHVLGNGHTCIRHCVLQLPREHFLLWRKHKVALCISSYLPLRVLCDFTVW